MNEEAWIDYPGYPEYEMSRRGNVRLCGTSDVLFKGLEYARLYARATGLPVPSAPAPRVKRPRKMPERPRGEGRKRTKLTESQVQEIRTSPGLLREIAAHHGISLAHTSRIRSGASRVKQKS